MEGKINKKSVAATEENTQLNGRGSKYHVLQKVKGLIVEKQKLRVERSPVPVPGLAGSFLEKPIFLT